MSEEIGRHKGAVETLLHEKKELSRLLQIVNGQLQRHLNALDEKGVDTDQFIDDLQQEQQSRQKKVQQQRKKQSQQGQKRRGSNSRSREGRKDSDEEFDLGSHLER